MSLSKRHLFERANELLAYLELSGSVLPEEDGTTIQGEFQKLRNIVKLASDYLKSEDGKKALRFCTEELDKALTAYEAKNDTTGRKYLDAARRHLEEARADKPSKATFIAGPNGQLEKL